MRQKIVIKIKNIHLHAIIISQKLKFYYFSYTIVFGISASAHLISPAGGGGFETSTTIALNNWIVANAATNT